MSILSKKITVTWNFIFSNKSDLKNELEASYSPKIILKKRDLEATISKDFLPHSPRDCFQVLQFSIFVNRVT